MNTRRKLIAALGAGALAASFQSFAQPQGKVWRVGWLGSGSGPNRNFEAFREQLRSLGYIEGRNLVTEFRWADGNEARMAEMAAELVRLKVDVIMAQGFAPSVAKLATSTIPIVMTASANPVGTGLIASLARPGGNITGMSNQSTDLAGKHLQLLREMVPKLTRVALLLVKDSPAAPLYKEQIREAAGKTGITFIVQEASDAAALAAASAAMQRERAQALIVTNNPFIGDNRGRIVELAAQHRLPSMFESRSYVDAGGLMSYGPDFLEMFRRAATYVDKIFKGAKPADLPVEQPTKFELIINGKTAKALGLKNPQSLLISADKVIE